jgi:nucleoside-diphosphate-sugar epimerase
MTISSVLDEDLRAIAADVTVPWADLDGSMVVVTGSTGLVGGLVVRALACRNEVEGAGISIMAPVRDLKKANAMLDDLPGVSFIQWDALSGDVPAIDACDYIIHCASLTASKMFISDPVETIDTTLKGTRALLELARERQARFCYVSSMEVYGSTVSTEPLCESEGGPLDSMNLRSSYPEAKQMAEALCAAFAAEYGVEACAARLAQTFGAGVPATDGRVFAEFARDCIAGTDITLLTTGTKSNMYVYTADAVRALLLLVTKGEAGMAYNVANEGTFCSIREMAQMVAGIFGEGRTHVIIDVDEEAAKRYPKSNVIKLDTTRVRSLGWEPYHDLEDTYRRLMADWGAHAHH